jgi:hypothetical protein
VERIKVFKGNKALARFFVIFGVIYTIVSLILLIKYLVAGFNIRFPSGDWNSVLFTFQGILFIIMGWSFLKGRKYFIEWNEKELRYLLPGSKSIEVIIIGEIKSIEIKLFEINFEMKPGIYKKLSLDNLEFEDIRKIKEYFGNLKTK